MQGSAQWESRTDDDRTRVWANRAGLFHLPLSTRSPVANARRIDDAKAGAFYERFSVTPAVAARALLTWATCANAVPLLQAEEDLPDTDRPCDYPLARTRRRSSRTKMFFFAFLMTPAWPSSHRPSKAFYRRPQHSFASDCVKVALHQRRLPKSEAFATSLLSRSGGSGARLWVRCADDSTVTDLPGAAHGHGGSRPPRCASLLPPSASWR